MVREMILAIFIVLVLVLTPALLAIFNVMAVTTALMIYSIIILAALKAVLLKIFVRLL